MGRQPDVYLEFALIALRKTVAYVGTRTLDEYLADDFCRSAVERELEVAGDSLGQLRKIHPDIANSPRGNQNHSYTRPARWSFRAG